MTVYLDDKRLAKRLLAGEAAAFDQFFEENFARLYRFSLARLPDEEAAREMAQQTLSRALLKLSGYRAEAALFTWLCAICRNEISDWLKRHARYTEHIVLIEDTPAVQAAVDSFAAPAEMTPEGAYERRESLRLIGVALDRLPPKYGDVLEWKYIEGHSVREIAARLGVGQEAAQSLMARARRSFAEVYGTLIEALREQEEGILEQGQRP